MSAEPNYCVHKEWGYYQELLYTSWGGYEAFQPRKMGYNWCAKVVSQETQKYN